MINEIYALFRETLPDIRRSEEKVLEILADKNNHIIAFTQNKQIAGVSVINQNTIYLLCVAKHAQNKGIGTFLLEQSEMYIKSEGFNHIKLGAGKDYIMPGVPMNNDAHEFFKKHGYSHAWGDEGCFDMSQPLSQFAYRQHAIGDTINGVTYRWATRRDPGSVILCVRSAEEKFVEYYLDKDMYEKGNDVTILVAEKDGEIVGTLQVCLELEGAGVGSVGCTTTMPKHQGKGIASTLVILGTKHLKNVGMHTAALGYTYTAIVNMYRRAGYEICMEYFMGEKNV